MITMTENRADTVSEVVKRLVEHYNPERIYLFGSSARGDARPDSDLDFLVVLPDDAPRESLFDGSVYERLWNIPLAVDVVPLRRRTFEERSHWLMSLPAIALREGTLEYEAGNLASVTGSE
jgi:predicted nucleotidyltransferase